MSKEGNINRTSNFANELAAKVIEELFAELLAGDNEYQEVSKCDIEFIIKELRDEIRT
jgi:hypothetical protein